ncbi:hypothetical protein LP419_36500 [Massilia sp. H-1]|nr:hypothetical protein LP419_36500 [Massilia sp. H-1]
MKRLIYLCTLISALAAPAVFAAVPLTFEKGAEPCKRNCGQTSQSGNLLLVTLVDKAEASRSRPRATPSTPPPPRLKSRPRARTSR